MPPVLVRAPRPGEAEALLRVWVARDVADTGRPDYTLEDVQTDLRDDGIDVLVAEVDGHVAGVAALEDAGCIAAVHPELEGRGIGTALREALERRAGERGIEVLRMHVSAANRRGLAHLGGAGYARAHHYVKLRAERDALPERAPAVPGLRGFEPGRDDRTAHAVVRDAFADIPGDVATPYERFRVEVLERAGFAPDLSFVVERDGEMVGCVLSERRDGAGYVGDLAVARAARGRRLGHGLLATALAAFRAGGLDGGELWVNGVNAPALGLYLSLGMREVTRGERWEKHIG